MEFQTPPTKILFVDSDESSFEFHKSLVETHKNLPNVELFHAADATEALYLLDQIQPDVVVLDDESREENELFLDSMAINHPQIVIQSESKLKSNRDEKITWVKKSESLSGIENIILLANNLIKNSNAIIIEQKVH